MSKRQLGPKRIDVSWMFADGRHKTASSPEATIAALKAEVKRLRKALRGMLDASLDISAHASPRLAVAHDAGLDVLMSRKPRKAKR